MRKSKMSTFSKSKMSLWPSLSSSKQAAPHRANWGIMASSIVSWGRFFVVREASWPLFHLTATLGRFWRSHRESMVLSTP